MYLGLWTCAAAAGPPVHFCLCAAPALVDMCCLMMPGAVDVCCSGRARGVCTQVGAPDTHVHVHAPILCIVLSKPLVCAVFWCQAPWTCAAAAGPHVHAPSSPVLRRKPNRGRERDTGNSCLLPFSGWW